MTTDILKETTASIFRSILKMEAVASFGCGTLHLSSDYVLFPPQRGYDLASQ
jgi:hypothetical protein